MLQQLAAPGQLDEEWRVSPPRHVGEHGDTGIAASSACDYAIRRRRARRRVMHTEKEGGCSDADEVTTIMSVPAAITEEK